MTISQYSSRGYDRAGSSTVTATDDVTGHLRLDVTSRKVGNPTVKSESPLLAHNGPGYRRMEGIFHQASAIGSICKGEC